MATGFVSKLSTVQHKEYFDRLASSWDSCLGQETLTRLSNIIAEVDIKPESYVLDVGSGTGVLVPFLTRAVGNRGKVIELDISAEMLGKAKGKGFHSNTHYIQADMTAIPMPDKVLDLCICCNAFPHCGNKLEALTEMARVIKVNGRLIICHTMSREAVNYLHQTIGGVVGNDLLPDKAELHWLLTQAGFGRVKLEDSPERYLVVAHKMP